MKNVQNVQCVVSVSTLPLAFKTAMLAEFWCTTREHPHSSEMAVKTLLPWWLHLCVRQAFLNRLQPKWQFALHSVQKQRWESSCLLFGWIFKELRYIWQCHSSHYFFCHKKILLLHKIYDFCYYITYIEWFLVVVFQWINKYLKHFSVPASNVINFDS